MSGDPPGPVVRQVRYFGDRFEIDWGTIQILRDGPADSPPGDYYQVTSTATRAAPYGSTSRPNGRTGPVLHRTRALVLKWAGFGERTTRPSMRAEWWCGATTGYPVLYHRRQVEGRHVCANCEARARAHGEEPSGLTLRAPTTYRPVAGECPRRESNPHMNRV